MIDEVEYVEVEPVQVGLFFTLMQQWHKNKPTILTSNLGFSEWGAFLKQEVDIHLLWDKLNSMDGPNFPPISNHSQKQAFGIPFQGKFRDAYVRYID